MTQSDNTEITRPTKRRQVAGVVVFIAACMLFFCGMITGLWINKQFYDSDKRMLREKYYIPGAELFEKYYILQDIGDAGWPGVTDDEKRDWQQVRDVSADLVYVDILEAYCNCVSIESKFKELVRRNYIAPLRKSYGYTGEMTKLGPLIKQLGPARFCRSAHDVLKRDYSPYYS
jgi:hypothetical protein